MKLLIKKFIKNTLYFFGLKVEKLNNEKITIDGVYKFIFNEQNLSLKNFEKLKYKTIKKKIIIFDIGANVGQSIDRFKKISPSSKIYSYEPVGLYYNKLKDSYGGFPDIKIFKKALGEKVTKKKINIYPFGSSSFFEMNNSILRKRRFGKSYVQTKELTSMSTLDIEAKKNFIKKINILKIDVQGYEKNVLDGAKKLMTQHKIDFIEFEIINTYLYNISKYNFSEIIKHFELCNYQFIGMFPNGRGNFLSDMELSYNLLFCNKKIYYLIKKFHKKLKNRIYR